ncbi:MAG: cytochrome ubiquinol oxidase subunit I [Nitrospira sp.]
MDLEPLHMPMMYGRVAIAAAALSHSLFATLVVGCAVIGAVVAMLAHLTDQPRHRRLAHMIAFALVLSTATISFFGVSLVFALNIFWPRFWHQIFRIMFWPFVLEACLFLGEAVFAYAWYYLWSWSSTSDWRKGVHLAFAWLAAVCAVVAMFFIDITASYMLTPHPPDSAWANILNPTMIDLDLHRWFGNLTWAGFALAAWCGTAFLFARVEEDRLFYRWAGGFCFAVGFGALLVMPVIGYQYLLHVRYAEPQAFHTLMLGGRSWLFDLVALFYGLIAVFGSLYILRVVGSTGKPDDTARLILPVSVVVLVIAWLVFAMPYHLHHIPGLSRLTDIEINPLGKMQPNKYVAIAALVFFGLLNWILFLRAFIDPGCRSTAEPVNGQDRASQRILIVIAGCTMVLMLTMGWVRETARAWNGYLVYGHIELSDEQAIYDSAGTGENTGR